MIKIFDYLSALKPINDEILNAVNRVLHSGKLILGPESEKFEREFAAYTGSRFCTGVNSGTSAITTALLAFGIGHGDEVITVSNTCVPTVSAIEMTGASPVFVDVNEDDLLINADLIKRVISKRTKAIVPVHLWGQSVDIDSLIKLAKENDLKVIEDCAQATGTFYKEKHAGTFGDVGCFSFYPTKNLGAYGDAGALITNDKDIADRIRKIRLYGYNNKGETVLMGGNFRISEIQSAILGIKIKYLPQWLKQRQKIAQYYCENIKNDRVRLPVIREHIVSSYHQFVIRTEERDALCRQFEENEIEFGIHYPVPVHRMPYYRDKYTIRSGLEVTEAAAVRILSIPVHEMLKDHEVNKVIDVINKFDFFDPGE